MRDRPDIEWLRSMRHDAHQFRFLIGAKTRQLGDTEAGQGRFEQHRRGLRLEHETPARSRLAAQSRPHRRQDRLLIHHQIVTVECLAFARLAACGNIFARRVNTDLCDDRMHR